MTTSIATPPIIVRYLSPNDRLPPTVWPTLEDCIDWEWTWVAVDMCDTLMAVLLTAPAHGVVIALRLWIHPHAPRMTFRRLFRTAAREAQDRGMKGWMVMLSVTTPVELKLSRLALRHKAVGIPFIGTIYSGDLQPICQNTSQ